jgi:hypothetical protein
MDRDELLAREETAWLSLLETVAAVPADRREAEGVVPGWSTHDLVWHCAYWTDFTGGVLERIRAGDPDPESGEDSEADILAAGRDATWADVIARAEAGRKRVRSALTAFDGAVPELGERWFREDTFEHYGEHAEQISAFAS